MQVFVSCGLDVCRSPASFPVAVRVRLVWKMSGGGLSLVVRLDCRVGVHERMLHGMVGDNK